MGVIANPRKQGGKEMISEKWAFRELNKDETRVLFYRHVDHDNNVLKTKGVIKCHHNGGRLQDSGVKISAAYSSPSPRALATTIETMVAYETMMLIHTDIRLVDMSVINPDTIKALKKVIADKGMEWNDAGIAEVALDPESEFYGLMVRRAKEGADCIRDIAAKHAGQTVLVTSHGVGRIEPALMILRNELVDKIQKFVPTGGIVELIIDENGLLVEENWLC